MIDAHADASARVSRERPAAGSMLNAYQLLESE